MKEKELKSLSGPIKLLEKAWKEYEANAKTFIVILIFPAILELVLQHIISSDNMLYLVPLFPIMLAVLILVYIPLLFWSNTALYLSIVEKSSDWKKSYSKASNKIVPFLLIILLTVILTLGGLALFIIPGIIFYVWCSFAPFVYFEQKKDGLSALARSRELVRGYWWPVFWRGLSIFLVSFMISIILGLITKELRIPSINSIIALTLTPVTVLYNFELYRELKNIHSYE